MRLFLAMALLLFLPACNRQKDVITEVDPFVVHTVPTPTDGKRGVLSRARQFARDNGFRMYSAEDHFSEHDYSLLLTKPGLNINALNVLHERKSVVRAYSRGQPDAAQLLLVRRYMCAAMNYCEGDEKLTDRLTLRRDES